MRKVLLLVVLALLVFAPMALAQDARPHPGEYRAQVGSPGAVRRLLRGGGARLLLRRRAGCHHHPGGHGHQPAAVVAAGTPSSASTGWATCWRPVTPGRMSSASPRFSSAPGCASSPGKTAT